MSSVVHHAIIVTSWDDMLLSEFAGIASGAGAIVLGPSAEVINGYRTVVVCPDGSKEGWTDSNIGDNARARLKKWLNEQRCEDGSSKLEWVEVCYGNDLYADEVQPSITDDQWRHR